MDDEVRAFCVREHPRLVGTLAMYTGDRHLAEECAQEALTRVVASWSKVRGMDQPGAYVHRVALNVAHHHFRRLGVRRRAERRLTAGTGEAVVAADATDAIAVRAAVAALPRARRAVVVLRYQAGMSHREIAEVLGITVGAAKSQLHRAMQTLREALLEEEDVDA